MKCCECSDMYCPSHTGSVCTDTAVDLLFRTDVEDWAGTEMCARCAADALESGVYIAPQRQES